MNTLPIIKLEIESMRHTLIKVLGEHATQMDEMIQAAIGEFCRPENLRRVVQEITDKEITKEIQTQIHSFYSFGDGRKVIEEAVAKTLKQR